MNTEEFIDELKRSLGNRSDISDARYVRWLNWTILDICGFHRKRTFRPRRFHELEDSILFKNTIPTGTCSSATDSTVEVTGVDISGTADIYKDQAIEVNGETHLIVSYNGTTVTILDTWDTTPSNGDEARILKKVFDIEEDIGYSPKDNIWVVEKIKDVSTNTDLEQVKWEDIIDTPHTATGSPSEFARRGGKIVFNNAPDEAITFRLYLYLFPDLLDYEDLTSVTNLPVTWDEAIVLGAMWRGYQKLMETDRAETAQKHYLAELDNRLESYYMEDGLISKNIKYRGR